MHRILLPFALLTALASSSVDGLDPVQADPDVTRAFVKNVGSTSFEVEVRVQHEVNCTVLDAAPWFGSAVRFPDEPIATFQLGPDETVPLVAEMVDEQPEVGFGCYVAELTVDGQSHVATIPSEGFRDPSNGPGITRVEIDASGPEVTAEGSRVQRPADLRMCEDSRPEWTPDIAGDFEIVGIEHEGDCVTLDLDEKLLEVCGVEVFFEAGDRVRIESTDTFLSITSDLSITSVGALHPYLPMKVEVTHDLFPDCAVQAPCGAFVEGVPVIEDIEAVLDPLVLVSSALAPVNLSCEAQIAISFSDL